MSSESGVKCVVGVSDLGDAAASTSSSLPVLQVASFCPSGFGLRAERIGKQNGGGGILRRLSSRSHYKGVEKAMTPHSNTLAWKIPGGAAVHGVAKSLDLTE